MPTSRKNRATTVMRVPNDVAALLYESARLNGRTGQEELALRVLAGFEAEEAPQQDPAVAALLDKLRAFVFVLSADVVQLTVDTVRPVMEKHWAAGVEMVRSATASGAGSADESA